jgi:hypothetical protein
LSLPFATDLKEFNIQYMKHNKDDIFRAMWCAWKGALQKRESFSYYHYKAHTFYLNRTVGWKVGMVNFIKSTYIKVLKSPCNICWQFIARKWHLVRNVETGNSGTITKLTKN